MSSNSTHFSSKDYLDALHNNKSIVLIDSYLSKQQCDHERYGEKCPLNLGCTTDYHIHALIQMNCTYKHITMIDEVNEHDMDIMEKKYYDPQMSFSKGLENGSIKTEQIVDYREIDELTSESYPNAEVRQDLKDMITLHHVKRPMIR